LCVIESDMVKSSPNILLSPPRPFPWIILHSRRSLCSLLFMLHYQKTVNNSRPNVASIMPCSAVITVHLSHSSQTKQHTALFREDLKNMNLSWDSAQTTAFSCSCCLMCGNAQEDLSLRLSHFTVLASFFTVSW